MTSIVQNSDFGLKLIDFGLAKQLGDEEHGVKIDKLQGTIGQQSSSQNQITPFAMNQKKY